MIGATMRAMVQRAPRVALIEELRAIPEPAAGQVRVRVSACGVCRTDLHLIDDELPQARRPIVPGHEVVGRIEALGAGVADLALGDRVGVPWLGWTCGECDYCRAGRENLCARAEFHGCTRDGGYAEYLIADARYVFPIPERYDDIAAAPLLCAGLIGFRAYRSAGAAQRLGLYGFGAAAHLLCQIAVADGRQVYAFTRAGDSAAQALARRLGAYWVGEPDQNPPHALDAAILFAPVGALVPKALAATARGGRVVCAGIHMSAIPGFAYELLWGERSLCSVANLTRADGVEFMQLAARVPIETVTTPYALADANRALDDLRAGRVHGAAVLVP
jgi:propanol-preferring alcohol dehydrogenase